MNNIYTNAAEAMAVAYAIAKESGKRVWRHTVESKYGVKQWLLSFNSDPYKALQEVTS